ncbi:MAG: class I SAM-dependent methyltransferase [Cytophagales bacterium]|nr:class I SAM-dependent methyltransferase [Cytophagales bacterium]
MLKKFAKQLLEKAGYRLISNTQHVYGEPVPHELEPEFLALYARVKAFTMTSPERLYAAYKAARYITDNRVPGAVVECGVWRGGSTMMMAHALLAQGSRDRDLYLYDTFEGMPEPTAKDLTLDGSNAYQTWKENQTEQVNTWCYSPLEEVQQNLTGTGYPSGKIHFVKGKVEDTIPARLPGPIALLRLDTDWFESTYHELQHLYPLLSPKGVLIIDDYGHWQGAREAVDQYFAEHKVSMLLNRIDYTGRIGIKA